MSGHPFAHCLLRFGIEVAAEPRDPILWVLTIGPPRITPVDRAFWVSLSKIGSGWREVLVIVEPDTVIRWHRTSFRL